MYQLSKPNWKAICQLNLGKYEYIIEYNAISQNNIVQIVQAQLHHL
jgi:hypothetical protein